MENSSTHSPQANNCSSPTHGTDTAVLTNTSPNKRSTRFWLIFVALCFCTSLSALDLGGIGTAAPTIVHDLNGEDFTWISSAYTLSSAACIPLSGNLAQIFGRRPVLLAGIVLFAAGSAISGSAPTMTVLIVGRAVQGVGGGTVQSLTSIVIADLVALRERGMFTAVTGLIWSLGGIIGPFIAGSLAEKVSWRWLFYINLPLSGVTFAVVAVFLRLHIPRESLREKLARVDWFGNGLIMASASSCMLALTWGGVRFPWSSARILVPLVLGLMGLVAAQLYESRWPDQPTIPMKVLSNRTSFAGYVGTFLQVIITITIGFYLPTWFQSVRQASPIISGLYFLPLVVTLSPSAIVQGLIVTKTGKYRLINLLGWCILLLGAGLLISVQARTSIGVIVVYQLIMGVGMGFLYATTFVVLAPLDPADNAAAVALLVFLRVFSQAWGVTIGGAILQNSLRRRIPASVRNDLPPNTQIAYAIIPLIASMPPALREQVQDAFLHSLRQVWIGMAATCGVGMCTMFFIQDIPLRSTTDKKWDTVDDRRKPLAELDVTPDEKAPPPKLEKSDM
ncbi:major facilitator superfamily domain-containing protein [Mycena sp. CBHHK59/15]|nr:major facilitator superfamily domain-containing protein [Mycena sp. CBHHK59/15]